MKSRIKFDLSKRLDAKAQDLRAFELAGKHTNVTLGDMGQAIECMQVAMAQALSGSKSARRSTGAPK
jgi:hypothetical protein